MNKTQFYFIEDQDYENRDLYKFKDYLYSHNYIINTLIIAKDTKKKDETLLKLIDTNLTENKKGSSLFIVCSGPLSLFLLSDLNYLAFDGMITFECSSLSSIKLNDFNLLKQYATKKINKENWKSYLTFFSRSGKYIKDYFVARHKLNKSDDIKYLFQVSNYKEKYQVNIYQKQAKTKDSKLITKGRFSNIETSENLFKTILENM